MIVADQSAVNNPRVFVECCLAAVVDDDQMLNFGIYRLQASIKQVIPVQDGDNNYRNHNLCNSKYFLARSNNSHLSSKRPNALLQLSQSNPLILPVR